MRRALRLGPRSAFVYAAGRFRVVRKLRRCLRAPADQVSVVANQQDVLTSVAPDINVRLRETGIACALQLAPHLLDELLMLETRAKIRSCGSNAPRLLGWDAIANFNRTSNEPVCMAEPSSPELTDLVTRIAYSEQLLSLVRAQLGGGIRHVDPRLQWSLVVDADDAWRESQAQTVSFHFDVHSLDFVYVFFYLTACGRDSGAHEVVTCSHINKPMQFLLGSARQNENNLRQHYPAEAFRCLEGDAGFGFIEDTSCFHRARVPVSGPRLALQIRYS